MCGREVNPSPTGSRVCPTTAGNGKVTGVRNAGSTTVQGNGWGPNSRPLYVAMGNVAGRHVTVNVRWQAGMAIRTKELNEWA